MINGSEVKQTLNFFNENVWIVFAITLSILILAVYNVTGHPIWDWIKRPKITVMPQKIERHDDENKIENLDTTNIDFWLNIKNTGKNPAIQCKPRLRLVGFEDKFTIGDTKDELPNDDFSIPWQSRDKKSEYEDILPSNRFERRIRIPMTLRLFGSYTQNTKSFTPKFNFYFDDPIETFVWQLVLDEDGNFKVGIELTITSINKTYHEKYFIVTIFSSSNLRITFDSIQFSEVNKNEFKKIFKL